MDSEDLEKRVAELERQLAEAKRVVRYSAPQPDSEEPPETAVDQQARRFARALRETLHPGGPSPDQVAGLREESIRAAADAGLSQQQYNDVLARAGLPLLKPPPGAAEGRLGTPIDKDAVVRQALLSTELGLAGRAGFSGKPLQPKLTGANRVGAILGMLGAAIGLCFGGTAALTALIPATALWTSPIVCDGTHHLAYGTSHYSYAPGQSGTTVSYQCVGDASSYDVSTWAVLGLQSLAAAILLGGAAAGVWLLRKRVGRR